MRIKVLMSLLALLVFTQPAKSDGWCPYCGINNNYYATPFYSMPSFFPSYYPMWGNYGALAYSNFYYPGAWSGGGMNGGFYPGGGGGFGGKPNIYISGKPGTEFKVKVDMKDGSNWLATAPVHGDLGWQGTLEKENQIAVNKIDYSFFYYDFRFDEKRLQDTSGFCTDRDHVISRMADGLKVAGFKENEIKDFVEHWSIKMPFSQRYCVYPQNEKHLNQIAELKIEPKPRRVTRLLYMVVVQEGLLNNGKKFTKAPSKEWNFAASNSGDRFPASDDEIAVREWGVGFVQGSK